jgi:hypothetical protein
MALKPDRYEFQTDITFYCNTATQRGVAVIVGSTGSGAAMDQSTAIAALAPTGVAQLAAAVPLGILLNDMVNYADIARPRLNPYKDEMVVGGKCTILRKGWVVTDQIATGITPVAGDGAYVAASGKITNVAGGGARIGTFLSAKDQAGFAKVEVNIV